MTSAGASTLRPRVSARIGEPVGITRGRLIVVAVVTAYFALLLLLGGHSHWDALGVPPLSPGFADLRSVTSGWECTRRGIAVLPTNPCDPFNHRPANYPHIWMWPAFLGLGQGSTIVLGILLATIFFAAVLAVLPRGASAVDGLVYGVAVCTPAMMLGVERGNVDLALFAIVVLGVLLLRRHAPARWTGHALILLAAILKLFPIFATLTLARQPWRRALVGGSVVLGLFAMYAAATLGNIRAVAHAVPQTDVDSYGLHRITAWLRAGIDAESPWLGTIVHRASGTAGLAVAMTLAILALAVLIRLSSPARFPRDDADPAVQRDMDLFYAGAGVYVLSYAFFRSFDYRLVFVLLTVPQLLRWVRLRPTRSVAILSFVGMFATLTLDPQWLWMHRWLLRQLFLGWDRITTLGPGPLPVAAAAQLLLFACYVVALVGTLRVVHPPHGHDPSGAGA